MRTTAAVNCDQCEVTQNRSQCVGKVIHDHNQLGHMLDDMQVGTMMAAADRFWVVVKGVGGHGALPHLSKDPVIAGTAIVANLQSLVSRETSPTDSAVVTVARFNTGAFM